MVYCTACGIDSSEHDHSSGQVVCTNCGSVLEENTIVSEIQFFENADGSSGMIGQFVPETGVRGLMRGTPGATSESREMTLIRAKRRLQQMADTLYIGEAVVDQAHRVYKLALNAQFTRGRRANHVIAACLYISCRREKTPHMLLDFSVALQTDVFVLGHTYLQLVRKLNFQLPTVEPFVYVRRFADRLEFGDKMNLVATTALKLVASMKRDWMQTGRRPAGLCAAALLIAARIHGFRRTQEEVARTVKVCATIVGRRIAEFDETPMAQMTPQEFEVMNEDEIDTDECNPPAFTRSELRKQLRKEIDRIIEQKQNEVAGEEEEASDTQSVTEGDDQPNEDGISRRDIRELKGLEGMIDDMDQEYERSEQQAEQKEQKKKEAQQRKRFLAASAKMGPPLPRAVSSDELVTQQEEGDKSMDDPANITQSEAGPSQSAATMDTTQDSVSMTVREGEDGLDITQADETMDVVDSRPEDASESRPEEQQQTEQDVTQAAAGEGTEDEDLLDIQDEDFQNELKDIIVTDENELQLRENIWDSLNLKWVRRMEEKKRRREEEAAEKGHDRAKNRKQQKQQEPRQRQQNAAKPPAKSAAEAAAAMLRQKRSRPAQGLLNSIDHLFTPGEITDRAIAGGDDFEEPDVGEEEQEEQEDDIFQTFKRSKPTRMTTQEDEEEDVFDPSKSFF